MTDNCIRCGTKDLPCFCSDFEDGNLKTLEERKLELELRLKKAYMKDIPHIKKLSEN